MEQMKLTMVVVVLLIGGGMAGAFTQFIEPFDASLDSNGWQKLVPGVTCDTSTNPGYATMNGASNPAGYYLVRNTVTGAGGMQEWDLTSKLLVDYTDTNINLMSVQMISTDGSRRSTFGPYFNRFGICDGVVVGSDTADLVRPDSSVTDLIGLFGATYSIFGYVNPCRLTEVELRMEKRSSSFEEQLDNGRIYYYTRLTGDEGNGPVSTDWIYMGYKYNTNLYTPDMLVEMYGDGMGIGGTAGATDVLYDYINVVPEPVSLALLGLGGLAGLRRRR